MLAAAIAVPGVVLVATAAHAVGVPTIKEAPGFPVDDFNNPGITTLGIPSGNVGNLVLVAIDTHDVTATGVSSLHTGTWHVLAPTQIMDTVAPRNLSIWESTVTSVGADTITVAYSSPPTASYTEIDADELASTAGSATTWTDVTSGSQQVETGSAAGITWPTLTSDSSSTVAQAYWGFGSANNQSTGTVTGGGTWSDTLWSGLSDNRTILNTTQSPSTAYSPFTSESATVPTSAPNSTAVGIIVSAAGTPAVPGAPTGAAAVAGNAQASVSWTAPTTGGYAITGYTVTSTPGGLTGVSTGAGTTATVTGLTNGTAYTFKVVANNAAGPSSASVASNSVTPIGLPGAPTIGTAVAGVTSASVPFTPPSSNGGATIDLYTATALDTTTVGNGGQTGTSASSPITVVGLTAGDHYTFTVTAHNTVGTGSASGASNPVIPTAPVSGGGGGGGGTPTAPVRVAGADRFATSIAASTAEFPTADSAGAVVLARSDSYPDALVGSPLAKAKNGPLLFAAGGVLTPETTAEIQRVLPAGGTVYILGGTAAVPASVATTLTGLGFVVTRLAGADRYATALQVAAAIGNPSTVLLATGTNYPDALSAGPAAAHLGGAVLLTAGSTLPTAVTSYLAAHPGTVYAIGGPAAIADPSATPLTGVDRYATAAAVGTLFSSPTQVGVASGFTFADALTGGAYEAHFGGPLLLTAPATLPGSTSSYLTGAKSSIVTTDIFGGTAAISAAVQTAISTALGL